MITYKVRQKNLIVNVYVPETPTGSRTVLLPGLPMSTSTPPIIQYLLEEGCIVYYPYYSGSYDSGRKFNLKNCLRDVEQLFLLAQKEKLTELYFGKTFSLPTASTVSLIAQSFGAAIALHGHMGVFNSMVLLSPALLYNPQDIGGEQGLAFSAQMKNLWHFLKEAHPYTYRTGFGKPLRSFLFGHALISRKKDVIKALSLLKHQTYIVHGKGDTSVPLNVSQALQAEVQNRHVQWKYVDAGHSLSSYSPETLRSVAKFAVMK